MPIVLKEERRNVHASSPQLPRGFTDRRDGAVQRRWLGITKRVPGADGNDDHRESCVDERRSVQLPGRCDIQPRPRGPGKRLKRYDRPNDAFMVTHWLDRAASGRTYCIIVAIITTTFSTRELSSSFPEKQRQSAAPFLHSSVYILIVLCILPDSNISAPSENHFSQRIASSLPFCDL